MNEELNEPVDGSDENYDDNYPSLSINGCIAKIKEKHAEVVALGLPGSEGKSPPQSIDVRAYWAERGVQQSYHISANAKRRALGIPLTTFAQDLAS